MTDLTDLTDLTDRPLEVRRDLTDHEQMLDAQSQCVPCKLCGGSAVISDAGLGAGYYIRCGNSLSMRDSKGCMLDERRLGGWAYNVMDWWNRLHAAATLETLTQENARLREALEGCEGIESGPNGRGGMRVVVHFPNGGDETALFHVLNAALAARKALGGCDE